MLYLLLIIPTVAIILWLMLSVRPRVKEKKRQERLAIFNQLKPEVEKAFFEIKTLYNFNHYITETERLTLLEDYRDLDSKVKPLLNSRELEEFTDKDVFQRFHNAMTDTKEHKTSNNCHFVDNQFDLIAEMRANDDKLIITTAGKTINVYDTNKTLVFTKSGLYPNSALFDKSRNCYWVGTQFSSLLKLYPQGTTESIKFNGPYNNSIFEVNTSGNDVWIASGGYTSTWSPTWRHDGFYHYDKREGTKSWYAPLKQLFPYVDIDYTDNWWTQIGDTIFAHPSAFSSGVLKTAEKAMYFFRNEGLQFLELVMAHTHRVGEYYIGNTRIIEQGAFSDVTKNNYNNGQLYNSQKEGFVYLCQDINGKTIREKTELVALN